MAHTLLAFHGYSLNAEQMAESLRPLERALAPELRVVCLNAPHVCSAESVDRLYAAFGGARQPPPHLSWWDASDDGREYRGWPETRALVREAIEHYAPVSLLGFSQGAILAAAIAGLSGIGELPAVHSVVLIAGRTPRALGLAHVFSAPVRVPSLHVCGERDERTLPLARELAERFELASRESVIWPGGHVLPNRGPAFDAIVRFLRDQIRRQPGGDWVTNV